MFSVVCISHTDGSGGQSVGRTVADRLGYRYVNEQLILEAARLAGVDPSAIAATEQKQTLVQRLLDAFHEAQESLGAATFAEGFVVPIASATGFRQGSKDELRSMLRAAIRGVGRQGNSVIVAHAASMALAGEPGVLRVLVTAPNEIRAKNVASETDFSLNSARDRIAEGDEGRREYLKTFYEIEDEAATYYDLVLNTEVLSADQATEIIVATARLG